MFHTLMRELIHMRKSVTMCQFRTTWAMDKIVHGQETTRVR